MAKDLPVKFVHYRGVEDKFKPEASGNDKLPHYFDINEIPGNIGRIRNSLKSLSARFGDNELSSSGLPVLVTAKLHEKATAKSYRPCVHNLFDISRKDNIIGMKDKNDVLVKIDNGRDLRIITRRFSDIKVDSMKTKERRSFATVKDLHAFEPEVERNIQAGETVKVHLADYHDINLNYQLEQYFQKKCKASHIELKKYYVTSNVASYEIKNVSANTVQKIASMDGIISIHKVPYVELEFVPDHEGFMLNILKPQKGVTYPIIGLMDSGVDCHHQHLEDWIKGQTNDDIAGKMDEPGHDCSHGTAVAGILIYGDELAGKDIIGCGPVRVDSCVVNSNLKISEIDLMLHIRDAVETHPDIRVWNLSQGVRKVISPNKFSDLAIFLDDLQEKHNILFCKSAGNIHISEISGDLHINEGADSLRSLVVGSINQESTDKDDELENKRSSFSRIGYGPEYNIKPDLVSYGGNTKTGVRTLCSRFNPYTRACGTSFSTPRIAALAATLAHRLGGNFDPLLIKAMLIHNAFYPSCREQDKSTVLQELGFGFPTQLDNMLFNDQDEFTMYWPFDLSVRGDNYQILDFPYPKNLVNDEGFYEGEIIVTLVYDPILRPSEANEYCQTDVDISLKTYKDVKHNDFRPGIRTIHRNEYYMVDSANVLANQFYSKSKKVNDYLGERALIEKEKKYCPVKKYHVNLSKMTPKNKMEFLSSNRHWGLALESHIRDAVEREVDRMEENLKFRAIVAVTIKDSEHRGVVYNECMHQLQHYNFLNENIVNRTDIQLDNTEA